MVLSYNPPSLKTSKIKKKKKPSYLNINICLKNTTLKKKEW